MNWKWIKIIEYFRTALLLAFAFPIIAQYFHWIKDSEFFTKDKLEDIKNIAILLYIIVYIIELRVKLKYKDNEIANLKTRLLHYEK
ncbi:hypothetical protein J4050_14205 [Winogradskyella sp. DF17]|jgi:hypothetical protein|uniref:Uncharacterized protein n=1 Tax=Winogradskyella pelagia TaxID=2819984 RepID=A0ABS3T584_9FLAO|nr:hypothetical protein [Winogradskyella sp. DF17]MBO3117905.1 hypothetical protein [Winogradskyella sp. DF17]